MRDSERFCEDFLFFLFFYVATQSEGEWIPAARIQCTKYIFSIIIIHLNNKS